MLEPGRGDPGQRGRHQHPREPAQPAPGRIGPAAGSHQDPQRRHQEGQQTDQIQGIGRPEQEVGGPAAAPARRLQDHRRPLAGERAGAPLEPSRTIGVAGRSPAHLAAGGLEDGPRSGQHDGVRGDPERAGHPLEDLLPHPLAPRRIRGTRFRHHHQPFRSQGRIGHPEHGGAPLAHPIDGVDHRLRFVRVDVASGLDDDVLPPSRQEQLAAGEIAEIARIEPSVAGGDGPGRSGVAVVAGHHRGAAELNPPLEALVELRAGSVDDPDVVPRQGGAAGYELEPIRFGARRGLPRRPKLPGDPIDAGRVALRGDRETDRALGQSVDRPQGVGPQSDGGEAFGEAGQRAGQYRLRPVEEDAERPEIEAGGLLVGDLGDAQIEREVRRHRQGGPMGVDGPQPAGGTRQEGERRQDRDRDAGIEGAQPGADEPHVVVERQPADGHVVRLNGQPVANGADVGEQVRVRQQDPFRLAGAAGRVLDEGRILAGQPARRPVRQRAVVVALGRELVQGGHRRQRRNPAPEQGRQPLDRREGDQQADSRVRQDASLALGVLANPIGAKRGVDRDRNRPGEQRSEEGGKERGLGPQHDRHGVPLADAPGAKRAGHRGRTAPQPGVGEGPLGAVILPQVDVGPIG